MTLAVRARGAIAPALSRLRRDGYFLCFKAKKVTTVLKIKGETYLSHLLQKFFNHHGIYSVRKFLTGLVTAAFTAWKLTVSNAMSMDIAAASTKIHQLSSTR